MGGAMLVLSFALLMQRRLPAAIAIQAVQATVLAAAACWQGFAQDAPPLFLIGLVTLAANGIAMPLALRRMVRRLAMDQAIATRLGILPSMVLGVALVAVSIMVVTPATLAAHATARESLAFALSVVLLGMLVMITRRGALIEVVGFMSLANGLILAAIGAAGMTVPEGLPMPVPVPVPVQATVPALVPTMVSMALSMAVLVLVAAMVSGFFLAGRHGHLDSPDGRAPGDAGQAPR